MTQPEDQRPQKDDGRDGPAEETVPGGGAGPGELVARLAAVPGGPGSPP